MIRYMVLAEAIWVVRRALRMRRRPRGSIPGSFEGPCRSAADQEIGAPVIEMQPPAPWSLLKLRGFEDATADSIEYIRVSRLRTLPATTAEALPDGFGSRGRPLCHGPGGPADDRLEGRASDGTMLAGSVLPDICSIVA